MQYTKQHGKQLFGHAVKQGLWTYLELPKLATSETTPFACLTSYLNVSFCVQTEGVFKKTGPCSNSYQKR